MKVLVFRKLKELLTHKKRKNKEEIYQKILRKKLPKFQGNEIFFDNIVSYIYNTT